jgi:hypothetical protein
MSAGWRGLLEYLIGLGRVPVVEIGGSVSPVDAAAYLVSPSDATTYGVSPIDAAVASLVISDAKG